MLCNHQMNTIAWLALYFNNSLLNFAAYKKHTFKPV